MKILNLALPEQSEIKYKISKFPDGQQQVNILGEYNENERRVLKTPMIHFRDYSGWEPHVKVLIKSRLNNFLDLELIICTVASLRNLGVKEIHLYCPYLEGSRSDRQFEKGSNNYLKQVICPIINSLKFESVTVLDPHSDVLEALIDNYKKLDNLTLVSSALEELYVGKVNWDIRKSCHITTDGSGFVLVSPDAGAAKKIYKLAEKIGYKKEVIICSKDRDTEGNLTKINVPLDNVEFDNDLIIIDDICDGGATFINIAKEIKEWGVWKGKLYLIVTHGIFSKGFEELSQYFDGIYCTNSYSRITFPWNMKGYLGKDSNQLNVF